VHLVWAPLGPEPLARFLSSYRHHDAGAPHRLLVVFNGFGTQDDLDPWRRLLAGVEHDELRLARPVLDLAAYREVAERVEAERYCFLNSYSEVLVDGWFAMLDAALKAPDVGLVGATGSWASTRSITIHFLRLPGPYRGVLPEPRVAMEGFMALEADISGRQPARSFPARMRARLAGLHQVPQQTLPFESFPAYHVRTNAFMIGRDKLAELRLRPVRTKRDAYLLENGRRSITRQLQRKGLRTVVVDREGASYDPDRWHQSRTFWQGDQEGLLVADNQTRCYADADAARRRLLSGFAWGPEAAPTLP